MATRQVSQERKLAYYGGMVLMALGLVVFVTGIVRAAGGGVDVAQASDGPKALLGFGLTGMALMAVGGFLRGVGAHGLAGSGAVLDPEQARRDLEPFSRQAGGMVKDALDEANVELGGGGAPKVVIRCRGCGQLNEEDSKFCQKCGKAL